MLAGSPYLFSPPELNLLQYKNLTAQTFRHTWGLAYTFEKAFESWNEGLKNLGKLYFRNAEIYEVYNILQSQIGNRILVDKSPEYFQSHSILDLMEKKFEDPLYIWLARHPKGVIDSYHRRGKIISRKLNGYSPEESWFRVNFMINDFRKKIPKERFLNIRYEDLVSNVPDTMLSIAQFIKIPYTTALENPYDNDPSRLIGSIGHQWLCGDPWFIEHGKIKKDLATLWQKSSVRSYKLRPSTNKLAKILGY